MKVANNPIARFSGNETLRISRIDLQNGHHYGDIVNVVDDEEIVVIEYRFRDITYYASFFVSEVASVRAVPRDYDDGLENENEYG